MLTKQQPHENTFIIVICEVNNLTWNVHGCTVITQNKDSQIVLSTIKLKNTQTTTTKNYGNFKR